MTAQHPQAIRRPLLRKRDVITPEHVAAFPHSYEVMRIDHHPNLAAVTSVDLSPRCPPVFDQGQIGSCTSNALLGAYEYQMMKQNEPLANLSRLFLYFQERLKEGTTSSDAGAAIQDGVWVLQAGSGVCREALWPYDITKFTQTPPTAAYADAGLHHAVTAQRMSGNLADLKQSLLNGTPIVFGIEVYDSFFNPIVEQTGVVPLPVTSRETLEGGHAICLVGFDDNKQLFKFRNSWGTSWGNAGYGYLPYSYVTNPSLSSDFWILTLVSDKQPAPPPAPAPAPAPTPAPPPVSPHTGVYVSSVQLPPGFTITFSS